MRVVKNNNFSVIDNRFLKNENLSLKAKGLQAHILTYPDDWKIYVSELTKHSKDGRTAVYSAIKELIKHKYIYREQLKKADGKFNGYLYLVFETPYTNTPTTPNNTAFTKSENDKNNIKLDSKPTKSKVLPVFKNPVNRKVASTNTNNNNNTNTNTTTTDFTKSLNYMEINGSDKDIKRAVPKMEPPQQQVTLKSQLQILAEKKLNVKFYIEIFNKLVKSVGTETIKFYIENWHKFSYQKIKNIAGFFISACKKNYPIPVTYSNTVNIKMYIKREHLHILRL